jgi:Mrp family chromosome partitioning ATPase
MSFEDIHGHLADTEAFVALRATVQSATALPAIVLVTSAKAGDGKSTVALGLARAFAAGNVDAVYIDANRDRPSRIICGEDHLSTVAMEHRPAPEFFKDLRARFGVIIVDAGTISEPGAALQVARFADAVIVAVRHGRGRTKQDEAGMAMLTRIGARVVGIVPVGNGVRPATATSRLHGFVTSRLAKIVGA